MQMSYVIPKLSFPLRVAAFAAFAAGALTVQLLFGAEGSWFPGALLMIPGLLFVWAKSYRNKPVDLGFEDWQPASAAEFNRIRSNLSLTRKKQFPALYKGWLGILILVPLGMLAFFLREQSFELPALILFDATVLLVPLFFSGNMSLWTPQELAFKMSAFEIIVASEPTEGGDLIITPYLRLDKDKEDRRIPEDIRLMVEPRRKPADFLGAQLQVAINKGPNGPVPYMYAVFLCRGKSETWQGTWKALSAAEHEGWVKEPGEDKEYGYIVVRQPTESGGYHTTDDDIRRLYALLKGRLLGLGK